MKFAKTISLDLKTIDLIDKYMEEKRMTNFSLAVCNLIKEHNRFKKIALKLQGKD